MAIFILLLRCLPAWSCVNDIMSLITAACVIVHFVMVVVCSNIDYYLNTKLLF